MYDGWVGLYCPRCTHPVRMTGAHEPSRESYYCSNCASPIAADAAFGSEAAAHSQFMACRIAGEDDGQYRDGGVRITLPDGTRLPDLPTETALALAGHILAACDGEFGDAVEPYLEYSAYGVPAFRAMLQAHLVYVAERFPTGWARRASVETQKSARK